MRPTRPIIASPLHSPEHDNRCPEPWRPRGTNVPPRAKRRQWRAHRAHLVVRAGTHASPEFGGLQDAAGLRRDGRDNGDVGGPCECPRCPLPSQVMTAERWAPLER